MSSRRWTVYTVAGFAVAFAAFLSLALLPAQYHRDWMPDVFGLQLLAGLGVIGLFIWARWRLTWGRIGRR